MHKHLVVLLLLACVLAQPAVSVAASSDLEVSGWIPYWRAAEGARDAQRNIEHLDEIHPFAFSVKKDGTLTDLASLNKNHWKRLFKKARAEDVEIIPTIMWSDTASIHAILTNQQSRAAHIKGIVDMVKKGKYDGVDIDYEGKLAETKDYFSLFLKDLKAALPKDALLSCTIEARTPPDSLYRTIPNPLRYANDFAEINKYCDRVKLMTYDQGRADIKLNDKNTGAPYIPVADTAWVEKVIKLALQSFPKEKLVLGVATYGREYQVTVSPNWYQSYSSLRAFNPEYALETAEKFDVEPSRNVAGELSYSYLPQWSSLNLPANIKAPKNTPPGNEIAARALAYANKNNTTVFFNLVWWSDAGAIEQKMKLAEKYDLRGIALFKIDGEEDPDIWELFE